MQDVADSLVVSGAVEGVCCEMIVDTGSNITIVRPDVLKRVAKDVAPDLHTVDSCLRTVTGETTAVRSRGRVNREFTIHNATCSTTQCKFLALKQALSTLI